jgi:ATP-binding protein involved in chromosome partitioning
MPFKMFQEKSQPEGISGVNHVIAIAAGKGGVGKSTVTVNLAHALKKMGFAVGVMDTDIYGPSIRKMLPEDRLPSQKGETIIPALSSGIKMISMAYFRRENEAAAVRAPIANGVVTQFVKQVEWGKLDFLLIDFPPGTGDIQLTLAQQANLRGAIMVTTPQDVAVLDVRKAMHLFEQVNIPIIGVIENMSYYHHLKTDEMLYLFGKGGGERLSRERGVPFLGQIPIDCSLSVAGDTGLSLFNGDGQQSIVVRVFMLLAEQLQSQSELVKQSNGKMLQNFELIWKDM